MKFLNLYLILHWKRSMRLSKFIASSGYASRRKSDTLIENGFVIVNNEVCRDFSTQVMQGDEVIVENTMISLPSPKIFSFYKPKKLSLYIQGP